MSIAIVPLFLPFAAFGQIPQNDRLCNRSAVVNEPVQNDFSKLNAVLPASSPLPSQLPAINTKVLAKDATAETTEEFSSNGVLCRVIDKNNKKAGVLRATSISSSSTDYFNTVMHSAGWSSSWASENIGALTVNIMGDLMGEDHLMKSQGSGWFWEDYRLNVQADSTNTDGRSFALLNFYLELINTANWIIITDVDNKAKGESYAMRAYAYFNLAQLYQQTYDGNQDKPCVPLYLSTDFSSEFQRSKLATVAEVYQQIDSDLDTAISLLAEYKALNYETENDTYVEHINYYIANGIKARVALVKHDFAKAELAAAEALKMPGLTFANSVEEITPLNSIRQPGILWGEYISPEEFQNYVSFFSFMDADFVGHYAERANQCISSGLYKLIPSTDTRRSSWWGSWGRVQRKYRGVYGENPQYDYIYMRAEEMILIMAEAQCALGRYSDARATITRLVEKRDSEYGTTLSAMTDSKEYNSDTNASPVTLMDYILLQRRIELWGENPRIFDLQRLHLGYNRDYPSSNHPIKLEDKNTSAGSELFIIPLPAEKVWASFSEDFPNQLFSDNANAIPETVGYNGTDYAVTEILDNAYNGLSASKVNIPKTIDTIDNYAFCGLSGVKELAVDADNVHFAMSNGVLFSKDGSKLIRYPDKKADDTYSVPSTVKSISPYAFEGAENLKQVIIPNSVTEIGKSAFKGCSGLTKVEISDIASWCGTTFGSYDSNPLCCAKHLYLNDNEIKDLVIPGTITTIKDSAFYGCSGLTSVTIPNSVTSIGSATFYDCSGLTSITIPNSVTEIGKGAFSGCSGLTSVTIPNSVTSIGEYAFTSCNGLTSLTIPNSVTNIGECAFALCSGLTSVTIPNSITSINRQVFYDCSGLTSITIPNSVTEIGKGAFSGCSGLTSVTIPNSVTSICEYAFSGCSGLTSISIPNSITEISKGVFYGCSGLTSIDIPNSVKKIGDYAFYNCSGFTSVTIPNSVTEVGSHAFGNCSGLKIVNWNVKNCADYLFTTQSIPPFYQLTGITNFNFGNEVEHIPGYLCAGLSGLSSITIPSSATSIGEYAFGYCSGLKSVTNHSLTPQAINDNVFYNVDINNCKLYVWHESLNDYKTAEVWKNFDIQDLGGVDGIVADDVSKEVEGYYNLQGIRLEEPARGQVNIVRYKDGTSQKVIVK